MATPASSIVGPSSSLTVMTDLLPSSAIVGPLSSISVFTSNLPPDSVVGPLSMATVVTTAFPFPVANPPVLREVWSGWDVTNTVPKLRIILESLALLSAPIVEKFVIGPAVTTFGPTDFPPEGNVQVLRQTAVVVVSGGMLGDLTLVDRIVRTSSPIDGPVVQLVAGPVMVYRKIIRRTNPSVGVYETLVAEPFGAFLASGTTVFSVFGDDVTAATTYDVPGNFVIDRGAAGISPGSTAVLIVMYQEGDVEPGLWSVFLIPTVALQPYLLKSELPPLTQMFEQIGQPGQLELEVLVPSPPAAWHGKNVAIGVSAFRAGGAPSSESLITWIGATTLVAPPELGIGGISTTSVTLLITHPVGENRVGAQVYRFPSSTTVSLEGVPVNREPHSGGTFTDGQTEPNRLFPSPHPEGGPAYPASGDRLGYVATELVETPFPTSALKAIQRKFVDLVPYTIFPAVSQAEVE